VQRTAAQLVEQLRRFLDSQMWLENKRIAELIRDIEKKSLAIKHNLPRQADFSMLSEPKHAEVSSNFGFQYGRGVAGNKLCG
jgi:hypothetical protein